MMRFVYWRTLTLGGWRWRWHLKARNGEIIAQGQGFRSEAACLHSINLVKASSDAPTSTTSPRQ
jgi:uncharacterized protein YegP (UPF0339 family)